MLILPMEAGRNKALPPAGSAVAKIARTGNRKEGIKSRYSRVHNKRPFMFPGCRLPASPAGRIATAMNGG